MQSLTVVLAAGSGLVLGFATASYMGAHARKLLESSFKDEKKKALKGAKKESDELREEVEEAHEKAATLTKQAETAAAEVEKLKESTEAQKKSYAETLEMVQAELAEARAALGDSAELSAALEAAGPSLDPILNALLEHQGQTAALLGDANGIVIASAGDADLIDRASAAANMLTSIPKQLAGILPLEAEFSFRLDDGKSSIAGQTFESAGELIALTTIGGDAPSDKAMESTLSSLRAALE